MFIFSDKDKAFIRDTITQIIDRPSNEGLRNFFKGKPIKEKIDSWLATNWSIHQPELLLMVEYNNSMKHYKENGAVPEPELKWYYEPIPEKFRNFRIGGQVFYDKSGTMFRQAPPDYRGGNKWTGPNTENREPWDLALEKLLAYSIVRLMQEKFLELDKALKDFSSSKRVDLISEILKLPQNSLDNQEKRKNLLGFFSRMVEEGNLAFIESFLEGLKTLPESERGVILNLQNVQGETALFIAASKGNLEMVQLLVEAGADLECRNQPQLTALSKAAQNGHLSVVKYLRERGAKLDPITHDKFNALLMATDCGHVGVVQYLIEQLKTLPESDRREILNLQNAQGKTALLIAKERGHRDIVRFLESETDKTKLLNFLQGRSSRLGIKSPVKLLDEDTLRIIADHFEDPKKDDNVPKPEHSTARKKS